MDIYALPSKALSIRQPWAWAILHAGKRIENRSQRFHYRGPICLHASLYEPYPIEFADFTAVWRVAVPDVLQRLNQTAHGEFARGGIIGTAEIVDVVEQSDSPWFFGPYGIVLENVRPVEFIPTRGALGIFDWRKRA